MEKKKTMIMNAHDAVQLSKIFYRIRQMYVFQSESDNLLRGEIDYANGKSEKPKRDYQLPLKASAAVSAAIAKNLKSENNADFETQYELIKDAMRFYEKEQYQRQTPDQDRKVLKAHDAVQLAKLFGNIREMNGFRNKCVNILDYEITHPSKASNPSSSMNSSRKYITMRKRSNGVANKISSTLKSESDANFFAQYETIKKSMEFYESENTQRKFADQVRESVEKAF